MKNVTILSSTLFALSIFSAGSSFAEDAARAPSSHPPEMRAQAGGIQSEQRTSEQEQTGEHHQIRAEHHERVREHMSSGETHHTSGSHSH